MGIEEQFYFLWPLIVLLIKEQHLKNGIIYTLLALPFLRALCLAMGLTSQFIFVFTLCHMDGLLLGSLISIFNRSGLFQRLCSQANLSLIALFDWSITALIFVFLIIYCFFLGNDQFIFNLATWPIPAQCAGITIISLPLAYIVIRAISPDNNFLQKAMNLKYLRMIGKYSYALYVLHAPICLWAGWHFPVPSFLLLLPIKWSFLRSLYIITIQFTLSIAAAVISWNILEKHFLKLKKYFPYRASNIENTTGGDMVVITGPIR